MLRQNMANRVKLTKTDSFVAVLRGAFPGPSGFQAIPKQIPNLLKSFVN